MRLIDADALADKYAHPNELVYSFSFLNAICHAPTIDAVPLVHGHLTRVWRVTEWYDKCSACGVEFQTTLHPVLFCPKCGVPLDELPDNAEHGAPCGDTKAAAIGDFMFLKPSAETSDVHAYEFDRVRGEYVPRKLTIGNNDGRQGCPSYEKEADAMRDYQIGDYVAFTSAVDHESHPEFYPPAGTVGKVVKITGTGGLMVQWPDGTTDFNGRWMCGPEMVRPACPTSTQKEAAL